MAATSGPRGGAYVAELTEVARLVSERVDGGSHPWRLVYQSRSGPPSQPWLEPDVRNYLAEIAAGYRNGAAATVLVPAGFVSDHMELKYDLDVEAVGAAGRLGIAVARAAAPGTHPRAPRAAGSDGHALAPCAVYQSRSPPRSPAPDSRYLPRSRPRPVRRRVLSRRFVSDHMEVKYDLTWRARRLGIAVARAATPGTHPRFVGWCASSWPSGSKIPQSGAPAGPNGSRWVLSARARTPVLPGAAPTPGQAVRPRRTRQAGQGR